MRRRLSETDRERVRRLLKHFHQLGYTLAQCNDPRRLKLDVGDLVSLADDTGLKFPDRAEMAKLADQERKQRREGRRP